MKVALFGGTGFVGSYLVDALLAHGHTPRLLVRPGSESKVVQPERCEIVPGDIDDRDAIAACLQGADAAIYNIGLLREFPAQGVTWEKMHYQGAARVIDAAVEAGVKRFLLMSANGVKPDGTGYQSTKFRAEQHLAASVRRVFPLGGPEAPEWREILDVIAQAAGKRKLKVPAPVAVPRAAAALLDRFAWFPVTRAQLDMLLEGNACDGSEAWSMFGIEPQRFEPAALRYVKASA